MSDRLPGGGWAAAPPRTRATIPSVSTEHYFSTEPGSRERWTGRITVRLEAGRPVALETAGGDEFRLSRDAAAEFRARVGESPWPLPPGFTPLALFIAESRGVTWSWELPLGPPWPAR